jgi:spore coat polysaccharide biosynthesis predicted glycosyltransferase SpsG/RimJ/RimL family protein N-acetyltransferase
MTRVAFRCDGDDRLGAGHVARCLRLAAALEQRGARCELIGCHEGAAAELVAAGGIASRPPEPGAPAGRPPDADALVVDSYDLPASEVEAARGELPVAVVIDGYEAPTGVTVLSYHLDAADFLPRGAGLLGPDYAPLDPRYAAARRPRRTRRVLVTVGGGVAGRAALATALDELGRRDGEHELFVAARERPVGAPPGSSWGWERAGLVDRVGWADLALSAAGATPYELACAGVPALLIVVADNQLRVAQAFGHAGLAVWLDARTGLDTHAIDDSWREVLSRASVLATAGPSILDGYGAFRAADGLLAAFEGRDPKPPLRYRPATTADADLLLAWRNDPEVRAASRSKAVVSATDHEAWLSRTLSDAARTLLVVGDPERPVGSVRFDERPRGAEISVVVAPDRRGAGLGSRMIAEASELYLSSRPAVSRVLAEILDHNRASAAAFERAGYLPAGIEVPIGSRMLAYTLA